MNLEEAPGPEIEEKVMVKVPSGATLEHLFTYHPPTIENVEQYKKVRESALAFAKVVDKECPPGPDKSAAIRKIREAVMTANAAIACCGLK